MILNNLNVDNNNSLKARSKNTSEIRYNASELKGVQRKNDRNIIKEI
jgi:hypothetical protein